MAQHSYINLRYGVLHSLDWVTSTGHRIHLRYETLWYEQITWC